MQYIWAQINALNGGWAMGSRTECDGTGAGTCQLTVQGVNSNLVTAKEMHRVRRRSDEDSSETPTQEII